MLQNVGLMTQALGLGGFPHFAAHPFIWFQALGFRMQEIPFSHTIGAGPLTKGVMGALGKDLPVPTAVGLERNGEVLIKPFCPPCYRNMEEAVLAFVDYKYEQGKGTFRDGGAATGWRDGARVQHGIPPYSDGAIAATVAYCEYVYERYGRFPANSGPLRPVLAPSPPPRPGFLRPLLPPTNAERDPGPASGLVARQRRSLRCPAATVAPASLVCWPRA
jgi:hypothetical protein